MWFLNGRQYIALVEGDTMIVQSCRETPTIKGQGMVQRVISHHN